MWVADMRKKELHSIYFDAFENDYLEEPQYFQKISSGKILCCRMRYDNSLIIIGIFLNPELNVKKVIDKG